MTMATSRSTDARTAHRRRAFPQRKASHGQKLEGPVTQQIQRRCRGNRLSRCLAAVAGVGGHRIGRSFARRTGAPIGGTRSGSPAGRRVSRNHTRVDRVEYSDMTSTNESRRSRPSKRHSSRSSCSYREFRADARDMKVAAYPAHFRSSRETPTIGMSSQLGHRHRASRFHPTSGMPWYAYGWTKARMPPKLIAALEHAASFLRREVARRLELFRVPELHFEADIATELGGRMDQLLKRIKKGRPRE